MVLIRCCGTARRAWWGRCAARPTALTPSRTHRRRSTRRAKASPRVHLPSCSASRCGMRCCTSGGAGAVSGADLVQYRLLQGVLLRVRKGVVKVHRWGLYTRNSAPGVLLQVSGGLGKKNSCWSSFCPCLQFGAHPCPGAKMQVCPACTRRPGCAGQFGTAVQKCTHLRLPAAQLFAAER